MRKTARRKGKSYSGHYLSSNRKVERAPIIGVKWGDPLRLRGLGIQGRGA